MKNSVRFTDRYVKSLKPQEKSYEIAEGSGEGFGVRVFPSGIKTFFIRYRYLGRNRYFFLGNYPSLSLAYARENHKEALKKIARGIDPGAEKKKKRTDPTVAALVTFYIEEWAKPRKRSWKEDKRQLERDVLPALGSKRIEEVSRREIRELVERVYKRGSPIASNRLLAVLRRMFGFAVEKDLIEISPCDHIKAMAKERRKDRVLSVDEIRALWGNLDTAKMDPGTKAALRLILVTAQRPGEVVGMKWEDIDGDWWTIPGAKSKNTLSHRVPLSPLALEILGPRGTGHVFPSPRVGSIHPTSLALAVRRNKAHLKTEPFTPHDLRRTAASHMTAAEIPRLTVSKILNHAEPGVTAVYDRHSYDKEKRFALESWARQLRRILKLTEAEGEIITFPSRG